MVHILLLLLIAFHNRIVSIYLAIEIVHTKIFQCASELNLMVRKLVSLPTVFIYTYIKSHGAFYQACSTYYIKFKIATRLLAL